MSLKRCSECKEIWMKKERVLQVFMARFDFANEEY
jgi:hypothetical protein